jgi:succinate dehydrogenase hydrophobic anchor subunit
MGAYMTVTRLDIAIGWPERQLKQRYMLQTISGEALLILKAVFLALTLEWRPLNIWVFVAKITNEFILWLDILHTYNASMDIGHQMLHPEE